MSALEKKAYKLKLETDAIEKENKQLEKQKAAASHAQLIAQNDVKIDSFKVNYKMNLIAEEGAYNLIVDSQLPMGQLILQSKQNLDVLNVKNNLAKISRISQIADPQIQSLTHLFIDGGEGELSGQSRIEIKIRTSEGQKGNIQLIVMA